MTDSGRKGVPHLTCRTVSPRKIISFRISSTMRSWIWNHFSLSPPPPPARRWTFQTVLALSRVVLAADSCVTLAMRSYNKGTLESCPSTSKAMTKAFQNQLIAHLTVTKRLTFVRLTITEIKAAQRKIHDRGILLFYKIILGETLKM